MFHVHPVVAEDVDTGPFGHRCDLFPVIELIVVAQDQHVAHRWIDGRAGGEERCQIRADEIGHVPGVADEIWVLRFDQLREFDRPLDRHQITDMHIADVGDAKPVPGRRPDRCGDIDVPDEHALGFVSGEQASAAEPIQPAGDEQMPQLGPSELG